MAIPDRGWAEIRCIFDLKILISDATSD